MCQFSKFVVPFVDWLPPPPRLLAGASASEHRKVTFHVAKDVHFTLGMIVISLPGKAVILPQNFPSTLSQSSNKSRPAPKSTIKVEPVTCICFCCTA